MPNITIHASKNIDWQQRLAPIIQSGLKVHNINANISNSPTRQKEDIAIILGPNFWKAIEFDGKPFIMMNRKFLGFGERDVHDNVCISWDGFNGRGTFCVDEVDPQRLLRYVKEEDFEDSVMGWSGGAYLLCQQADVGRCKKYQSVNAFYSQATKGITARRLKIRKKINPENTDMATFRKNFLNSLKNIEAALVLNSTVSVEITMAGIPVVSFDEGDPVYAISSRSVDDIRMPFTRHFLEYMAHCQWHYDEIKSGKFWEQIYPKRGPRLCEWKDESDSN